MSISALPSNTSGDVITDITCSPFSWGMRIRYVSTRFVLVVSTFSLHLYHDVSYSCSMHLTCEPVALENALVSLSRDNTMARIYGLSPQLTRAHRCSFVRQCTLNRSLWLPLRSSKIVSIVLSPNRLRSV